MALAAAAAACAGFSSVVTTQHQHVLFVHDLNLAELLTLSGVYEIASRALTSAEILAADCCDGPTLEAFQKALRIARAGAPAVRAYLFERTQPPAYSVLCPARSSVTEEPCTLPAGHPAHSPTRFHRFEKKETP
jgi:hypothetical protein